jgi:hypothetical protein
MRTLLFFSGFVLLFACGGTDGTVPIGSNDSGSDGTGGGDGSARNDSGGGDATDSGADVNMCMPKMYTFTCRQGVMCNGGDTEYCEQALGGAPVCKGTPNICACDYTCKCLLANAPNPCGQFKEVCTANGTGPNSGFTISCGPEPIANDASSQQ